MREYIAKIFQLSIRIVVSLSRPIQKPLRGGCYYEFCLCVFSGFFFFFISDTFLLWINQWIIGRQIGYFHLINCNIVVRDLSH